MPIRKIYVCSHHRNASRFLPGMTNSAALLSARGSNQSLSPSHFLLDCGGDQQILKPFICPRSHVLIGVLSLPWDFRDCSENMLISKDREVSSLKLTCRLADIHGAPPPVAKQALELDKNGGRKKNQASRNHPSLGVTEESSRSTHRFQGFPTDVLINRQRPWQAPGGKIPNSLCALFSTASAPRKLRVAVGSR